MLPQLQSRFCLKRRMKLQFAFLFLAFLHVAWATPKTELENHREKKLFSLFSIVTFKNEGCSSNSGTGTTRNGTCYTSTECTNKGGTASGNCAAGFGVCCLFIVSASSSTITENCTYIQNPGFPAVLSTTTSLTYTINKCSSDVCAVRLDFESFTTLGPALTTEATGGACVDSLVVTGTSGLTTPVICGKNTGQHIYMDMGAAAADTAVLTFTFDSQTSTVRTFEIKATQIPCAANYRPPSGCLQYHTGLTGVFTTFNYIETTTKSHLATQEYSICIRQELGYCCVAYSKCSDADAYTLDVAIAAMVETDTNCAMDYLGIDGASFTCDGASGTILHSRICGPLFGVDDNFDADATQICDCTAPFVVEVITDNMPDPTASVSRGVCLEYMQIPCTVS